MLTMTATVKAMDSQRSVCRTHLFQFNVTSSEDEPEADGHAYKCYVTAKGVAVAGDGQPPETIILPPRRAPAPDRRRSAASRILHPHELAADRDGSRTAPCERGCPPLESTSRAQRNQAPKNSSYRRAALRDRRSAPR